MKTDALFVGFIIASILAATTVGILSDPEPSKTLRRCIKSHTEIVGRPSMGSFDQGMGFGGMRFVNEEVCDKYETIPNPEHTKWMERNR